MPGTRKGYQTRVKRHGIKSVRRANAKGGKKTARIWKELTGGKRKK